MGLKLAMEVMINQDCQTTEKANLMKIRDAKSRILNRYANITKKIVGLPKKANLAGAEDAKLWV
jgi:hypothetical protein